LNGASNFTRKRLKSGFQELGAFVKRPVALGLQVAAALFDHLFGKHELVVERLLHTRG